MTLSIPHYFHVRPHTTSQNLKENNEKKCKLDDSDDDDMMFSSRRAKQQRAKPQQQQQQQQQQPKKPAAPVKPEPTVHTIGVTLAEMFTGCTKKLKLTRTRGGKSDDKIIEIEVRPGWKAGTKLTYADEGDQAPNGLYSDVIFVIAEKPNDTYTRNNNDLIIKVPITISDALCGINQNIYTILIVFVMYGATFIHTHLRLSLYHFPFSNLTQHTILHVSHEICLISSHSLKFWKENN